MNLSGSQVRKILRKGFKRIDFDSSGTITVLEFIDFVGAERTPFMERLLQEMARGVMCGWV